MQASRWKENLLEAGEWPNHKHGKARTPMVRIGFSSALITALRLILGAFFIISGFEKLLDLKFFGLVIAEYQILPSFQLRYFLSLFWYAKYMLSAPPQAHGYGFEYVLQYPKFFRGCLRRRRR